MKRRGREYVTMPTKNLIGLILGIILLVLGIGMILGIAIQEAL